MKSKLVFISSFIKNPREVAAVAPSSKYLISRILKNIDFKKAKCVVEYGPGTGAVTESLLKHMDKDSKLICFELNKEFFDIISRNIGDPRLIAVNDTAEKLDFHLKRLNAENIDYVLSGLPFSLIKKENKMEILKKTCHYLKKGGKFIVYQQYNSHLRKYLKIYFKNITSLVEFRNIPPSYIFACEKQ